MKLDLNQIETEIMQGLKDFQRATVNRVFELFQTGQNRVLVADEVGLGKTLIAKGIISKTSRYHYEELKDDLFKVVYICSNSSIASQNMKKLKISKDVKIENVSDTRLSMQHLKIFEQENDEEVKDSYIQLIPLTPLTSFSMTNGGGNVSERALMFAILKRMELFKPLEKELETLFIDTAFSGWKWAYGIYEPRVSACNEKTNGQYILTMIREIEAYLNEHPLLPEIIYICKAIRENGYERISGTYPLLQNLRMMFARISVERMNPDLVIMDEFQRFKFLISQDIESETGILADRFLKGNETNILLLSATPYKLYSTLEEISENQSDDHYAEFFQVMDFLFQQKLKQNEFKEIWSNYSASLREINHDHFTLLEVKNKAEDAMYQAVCRTERISAIDTGDFIDDRSVKAPIKITNKDVLSYIEAENLLSEIGEHHHVPVDYVKSTPYLLSFMKQYQLKQHVEKFFKKYPDQINLAKKKHLWIDKKQLQNYRELEPANARLEKLKEAAFENQAELLLWVPPSKPYYEPQGVYKDKNKFSKILVFSAWEMVPRMIASLISYEAERKTVGRLVAKNKDKKNTSYFAPNNKRFPVARLRFNVDKGTPHSMSLFCLLYPSVTLANLYDPISRLNEGKSLEMIENELMIKVSNLIDGLKDYQNDRNRTDDRWYFLAPLLFDGMETVKSWFEHRTELLQSMEDEEEERGHKGFLVHLDHLEELFHSISELDLGKMPNDLTQVLVKLAISSPAVCAYRSNGNNGLYASQLAKAMINLFNRTEATAIIELCYGGKNSDAHWKNVLHYCCDGNFQALFDEYVHLMVESNGVKIPLIHTSTFTRIYWNR
ncbi:DEAD/DEAH box helicase family protein [Bacillus marasmi]|uniref:DEAD/DEAH box helicase family protein n=1 Tax=Bacillus marasmi TaxID=1926279 RepID=UPI001FE47DF2|nr:DEAD/DEAH box helicase family protein [Bacillus marasmi]